LAGTRRVDGFAGRRCHGQFPTQVAPWKIAAIGTGVQRVVPIIVILTTAARLTTGPGQSSLIAGREPETKKRQYEAAADRSARAARRAGMDEGN
jgi:hypothetical protein